MTLKDPRAKKLAEAARENLIKSEVLNFRMSEAQIKQLYEVAAKKNVRISQLLRDWTTEKLNQELTPQAVAPDNANYSQLVESHKLLVQYMNEMNTRTSQLETVVSQMLHRRAIETLSPDLAPIPTAPAPKHFMDAFRPLQLNEVPPGSPTANFYKEVKAKLQNSAPAGLGITPAGSMHIFREYVPTELNQNIDVDTNFLHGLSQSLAAEGSINCTMPSVASSASAEVSGISLQEAFDKISPTSVPKPSRPPSPSKKQK